MESELKEFNSASRPETPPPPFPPQQKSGVLDDGSIADDRPLLKLDASNTASPNSDFEELEKKCAAYARHDVYGRGGRGELPWIEKVKLGFALCTLVPVRVVLAMTVLVSYYSICKACTLFLRSNRENEEEEYARLGGWRRAVIVRCGRFASRAMLFVFGFYWIKETCRSPDVDQKFSTEGVQKDQNIEHERIGAIVSNHISYLDILYHMSSSFPSIVAKRSVARLPLVGLISKCLGCVYVQRESKSSDSRGVAGVVTERILETLRNEFAPVMLLFPEGTTTNGEFLLPFKTGAFLSKASVLPVILKYPYQRFSPAWDSMSGMWHVILLLCQFVNFIEVTRLPAYQPSPREQDDPTFYAANVRSLMAREGNLKLSDIGLAEKRLYLAALNGNNRLPTVLHQKDD